MSSNATQDWTRRARRSSRPPLCVPAAARTVGDGGAAPAPSASRPRAVASLTSIDDLKDKRIGVQLGTVYDIYATKTFPHATVLQYPTYQEVTLAVSVK